MHRNRIDIIRFEKYMKPSDCCQACLSSSQLSKDCIITCELCRSCIHQTHYGSQLSQPPQVWQCQRCRYFLQNGPCDIHCQFCPNLRGIMKQYFFDTKKIWLHPQCAVWGFPIIYFASNKKQGIRKQKKPKNDSTYFWVRDYDENQNPCEVCNQKSGYRIKCKYYSCTRSYHVTCARPQGIIRDLESMKIENGVGYFPVYCRQHIQLKIQDCKKRVKNLKQLGDSEKAAHFHKVGNLFIAQLKNLQGAAKKCKLEQQMIKKLSIEGRRNVQTSQNATFSQLDDSFTSQHSNQFLQILQEYIIDQQLPLKPIQALRQIKPQPLMKQVSFPGNDSFSAQQISIPTQQKVQKPTTKHKIIKKHHRQPKSQSHSLIIKPSVVSVVAEISDILSVPAQNQNNQTINSSINTINNEKKIENYEILFDQF